MKTIILGTAILLSLLIYRTIEDTQPEYSLEYYERQKQELERKHALELYKLNSKIEHLK
jgi:hypothetical protein